MTLQSGLYLGEVRHRRRVPVVHEFRYRLFMAYLDLDELSDLFRRRWLWSDHWLTWAWFRRADHLGPAEQPLDLSVRDLVEQRLGYRPAGPIRLLTHLRYGGFAMNPISLFYGFNANGACEYVIAEVNNTPWGEQHCYVLDLRQPPQSEPTNLTTGDTDGPHQHPSSAAKTCLSARTAKAMHVSPFMTMDHDYWFRLTAPKDVLTVHIENHRQVRSTLPTTGSLDEEASANTNTALTTDADDLLFDATMTLRRRPWTTFELARCLLLFPCMTWKVYVAIYWQALRLWWRGVPYVPHPDPPALRVAPPTSRSANSSAATVSQTT